MLVNPMAVIRDRRIVAWRESLGGYSWRMRKISALIAAVLIAAGSFAVLRPSGVEATTCAVKVGTVWGLVKCTVISPPDHQVRAYISCDHGAGGGTQWVSAVGPWTNQGGTSIAWCPAGYTRVFVASYQFR